MDEWYPTSSTHPPLNKMTATWYMIFSDAFFWIKNWILIKISLKCVDKGLIDNNLALVWIMAWRRIGDKPLSEPTLTRFTDAICDTRGRWVDVNVITDQRCKLNIDLLNFSVKVAHGYHEVSPIPQNIYDQKWKSISTVPRLQVNCRLKQGLQKVCQHTGGACVCSVRGTTRPVNRKCSYLHRVQLLYIVMNPENNAMNI